MQYLKERIQKLETNSEKQNIGHLYRGISEFKRCYQPRTNLVNGYYD